jgi:Vitamin K-dependent gamma-carboxylase
MPIVTPLLQRYLSATADPRPLAMVRIIVGLVALASAAEVLFLLPKALDPAMLHLPLLPLLPRLPQATAPAFVGAWMVCALLLSVGLAARPAALALMALVGYYILLDQQLYSNHHYLLLLLLLLLGLARSDATLSLEARQRRRRVFAVPGWPVILIQLQLTAVYIFSVLSKLNLSFLSGEVISGVTAFPLPLPPTMLALLTIAVELFIAYGLWRPRLRLLAALAGLALHGGIVVSMGAVSALDAYQLGVFSALICAPYLLFFAQRKGH